MKKFENHEKNEIFNQFWRQKAQSLAQSKKFYAFANCVEIEDRLTKEGNVFKIRFPVLSSASIKPCNKELLSGNTFKELLPSPLNMDGQ